MTTGGPGQESPAPGRAGAAESPREPHERRPDLPGAPGGPGAHPAPGARAQGFRSGFVALIGRPNVGKSTLLNQLIGRKIAIMSDKPQTTRTRILGVLNRPGAQLVFVDTPGIHKPQHLLGEHMVQIARRTLQEVEAVCWLVEAPDREPGPGDRFIAEQLAGLKTPRVLVVNKIDQVAPGEVPAIAARFAELGTFAAVHPVSALHGVGVAELVGTLEGLLPEGPRFFPEDMVTDQPEAQIMAELIREQILHLTREEVPHAVAVQIEKVERRPNGVVYVPATIYVEREGQKRILIGEQGRMLKEIGRLARLEIEALLGSRIYLDLWVKVKPDWRNKQGALSNFGFHQ
ncbi:GTPase Era [Thermaerobacter subterraneus]|uniref:GTPase Era n=1 Tax=Thermaerobacter subterraneus DSM 13965 TaxID=867903 RepID=K6QDZ3_9FIRM|nr:GTPase Era [Thermaerobacter subterraneus]EKP94976.1 GTP-binding protein Era [Thermaerobacter subterraneus DSM 13965]